MVTWILYAVLGLLATVLITQGLRLLIDPAYRELIFLKKAQEDERVTARLARFPGLVRWLMKPDIRDLRPSSPEGLRRSGFYLLWMGSVMGVGWLVGVIMIFAR
jgi:hypothetical protein